MRRMIAPETIIKSQIVDDKSTVDLNEILEKYGVINEVISLKSVTLQFYSQMTTDDFQMDIITDTNEVICSIVINTAITISKDEDGSLYIRGLLVDNLNTMNLISYIQIDDGNYENGIILGSGYPFDVHVIKV